jgi:hypothetical protein
LAFEFAHFVFVPLVAIGSVTEVATVHAAKLVPFVVLPTVKDVGEISLARLEFVFDISNNVSDKFANLCEHAPPVEHPSLGITRCFVPQSGDCSGK